MNKLFQSMFPDSAVAESFQLGSDKLGTLQTMALHPTLNVY